MYMLGLQIVYYRIRYKAQKTLLYRVWKSDTTDLQ